jgi:hypothetical protein
LVSYKHCPLGGLIVQPIPIPDKLKPLATEIATLFRELPRLLAEGQEGRFALVRGDTIAGIFDTFEDAYTAGYGRFAPEAFLAQPIDSRDLDRLAPFMAVPPGSVSA